MAFNYFDIQNKDLTLVMLKLIFEKICLLTEKKFKEGQMKYIIKKHCGKQHPRILAHNQYRVDALILTVVSLK